MSQPSRRGPWRSCWEWSPWGAPGGQGDGLDAGSLGDAGPSGPSEPDRTGARSGEVLVETPSYAFDLLLDGETLYYTTTRGFGHQAALWRVPKAGGQAERLHQGPGEFWRLAQDEEAVYAAAAEASLVFRYDKSASAGAPQILGEGHTTTGALARVGDQLHFGTDLGVYAVPATGGSASLFARSDPPTEMASWGGQLVWTSYDTNRVWLQRLDAAFGEQAELLSEQRPRPYSIEAGEAGVFWISGGTKPLGEDGAVIKRGWNTGADWVLSPISGGICLKLSGNYAFSSSRPFSLQSEVPSQDKGSIVGRRVIMSPPGVGLSRDFQGHLPDLHPGRRRLHVLDRLRRRVRPAQAQRSPGGHRLSRCARRRAAGCVDAAPVSFA